LLPSGLGTAVLMPAPWAKATRATETYPGASLGIKLKSGICSDLSQNHVKVEG
jgi:hypothetical protein